jgi:hypothetical protein
LSRPQLHQLGAEELSAGWPVRADSAAAREGVMEAEAAAGKARVVVVGAGVAGSLLAKTMQGHAHVVLLDP